MAVIRRHPLWFIAGVGLAGIAVRLFFAFHWFGSGDIFAFEGVGLRSETSILHSYGINSIPNGFFSWNYPPAYLLWLVGALKLARSSGLPFDGVVQLLPILADLGIALAVYVYLGWRGAGSGSRVAGFSLVMLGPVFIAISGYHGQVDPVAILPGVLAFMVWERRPKSRRALESGLLIGIGAIIKTVPMLLVLPLMASARSVKEGAKLVASAVLFVALMCLPFVLAEPAGFKKGLAYIGVPGRGGLSLIADPGFAVDRRLSPALAVSGTPNDLANSISRASGSITLIVLLALAAFLFYYRPAPIDGVVLLWLAVFVFSPNFLFQYLVWALPFFIMAGYLRETALLQVAVIPALLITYLNSDVYSRPGAIAYVVMMIFLWVFWVVALATAVRRIIRGRSQHPGTIQPPLVELGPAMSGGSRL